MANLSFGLATSSVAVVAGKSMSSVSVATPANASLFTLTVGFEKRKERDTYAESAVMARSKTEAALKHRCPACGGPISDGRVGSMFCCLWCGEKYGVETGELVPKPSEALLPQSKPKMSDFYALQPNR